MTKDYALGHSTLDIGYSAVQFRLLLPQLVDNDYVAQEFRFA